MKSLVKKSISGIVLTSLVYTFSPSVYADELSDVQSYVNQIQSTDPLLPSVSNQKGLVGSILATIFRNDGKLKNTFIAALGVMNSGSVPRWNGSQFVTGIIQDNGTNIGIGTAPTSNKLEVSGDARISQKIKAREICDENGSNCADLSAAYYADVWSKVANTIYYMTGNVGVGTMTPNEQLSVSGSLSVSGNPDSGDDVGNRDYNDARYINVGEAIGGDIISDGTIDSSEIEDNTLTAADLSANSVGDNELDNYQSFTVAGLAANGTITSTSNIGNKDTDIGQQMEKGTTAVTTLRFDSDRYRIYAGGTGGGGDIFSILENGNVGIGTMAPSTKLHVNGNIQADMIKVTCIGNCY